MNSKHVFKFILRNNCFKNYLFYLSYSSSKNILENKTYGFHGAALFNIIHLSDRVEIISGLNGSRKILKQFSFKSYHNDLYESKTIELNNSLEFSLQNFSTLIRVYNLFGKFPIRQRQLRENSSSFRILLNKLQIIALINYEISFYLQDVREEKVLFRTEKVSSLKEKFLNLFEIQSLENALIEHKISLEKFKLEGLVYIYSRMTLSSKFQFNLSNILNSKAQFIYFNNFYISNRNYYDLISNEISSCKEFNILNLDPSQIVFCLSIKSERKNCQILNKKSKQIIQFENADEQNEFLELIKYFFKTFLLKNGFKKIEYEKPKIENKTIAPNTFIPEADDLKNSKVSKLAKDFEKTKPKFKHLNFSKNCFKQKNQIKISKDIVKLNLIPDLIINKRKLPKSDNVTRLSFIELEKKVKNRKKTQLYRNKSTQTEVEPYMEKETIQYFDYNQNISDFFITKSKKFKTMQLSPGFFNMKNGLISNLLIKWKNKQEFDEWKENFVETTVQNCSKIDQNILKNLKVFKIF